MHRLPTLALAAILLGGCLGDGDPHADALAAIEGCRHAPATEHVYFFGPGGVLQREPSPKGFTAGNAFSSGFLTNDLKEWLSEPLDEGLWLVGEVTLEFWARSRGTPAPLVIGAETPGEGYHFFNQFGTDRTFSPVYATEYSSALPTEGTVEHYTEVLYRSQAGQVVPGLPPGGFVAEKGDRLRVLLTDLALDDGPMGSGHDILFGGDTPSHVRFTAKCWSEVRWTQTAAFQEAVTLPGNQGLLTGGVPASEANQALFPFTFSPAVDRVSVTLVQTSDANPVKDDVDLWLLNTANEPVYAIGSPYSDEKGTLWLDNLRELFPGGYFTVQVDSYSGVGYTGVLSVTFDTARA